MNGNGIYKITNTVNGKIYIGSTFCKGGFKRRWIIHKSGLKRGKHPNKHLQSAWNKYGEKSFLFEKIESVVNHDILLEREQYYIDIFKSYNDKIGYNILEKAGNTLGYKHTEESKRKIGKASEGNEYSLGFKHTEETKELMSKAKLNESKETRNKRAKSLIGNKNSLGVTPVNITPVCQLDIAGNEIKTWKSMANAGNELNISTPNIFKVCNGERKTCGGFKWKYVN